MENFKSFQNNDNALLSPWDSLLDFMHILVHFRKAFSTLNFYNIERNQYFNDFFLMKYFRLSKLEWVPFQEEAFPWFFSN